MPVTKSDIPNLLEGYLRSEFFNAYLSGETSDFEMLCTQVPSTGDSEPYAWLGDLPGMREFLDERQIQGLSEFDYSLKNKKWESTIAVDRDAIEDDRHGQIVLRVRGLANAVKVHKGQLVMSTLAGGFAALCFDGLSFFNNSHVVGGGTNDNYGTAPLTAAALQTVITAMKQYKNDKGNFLGINPNVLVVPPALEFTAKEILQSQYKLTQGSGEAPNLPNLLQGYLKLVVDPYCIIDPTTGTTLSSGDLSWYVLDTTKVVRPILLQNRKDIEFMAREANSTSGFMRDEWLYGVRARYNAGYGLWQCAYGNKVSS